MNSPTLAVARPTEVIRREIAGFYQHLQHSADAEACLPPIEIIPAGAIHRLGDTEEEVPEEVLRARVLIFVHKLMQKDVGTWRSFLEQIVKVREARLFLLSFTKMAPAGALVMR